MQDETLEEREDFEDFDTFDFEDDEILDVDEEELEEYDLEVSSSTKYSPCHGISIIDNTINIATSIWRIAYGRLVRI